MTDTKHDDGGFAFPLDTPDGWREGMTLEDHFAGKAMEGMLASGWLLRQFQNNAVPGQSHGQAIENASITLTMDAYNLADAMIAEKRRRESL